MKPEPLIIEQSYPASIEKVWKAITDIDQLKKWFFPIREFKPEIGFEFQFEAGMNDVCYLHLCKITELIPGKKITYSWRYAGFPGNSFVSFELFDEGDYTRVRLKHEGLETLPMSRPGFLNGYYIPGWEEMISVSLRQFLE